jgi:hypothetical protein
MNEALGAVAQAVEGPSSGGIVKALGELAPGAILSEVEVARIFKRHPASVKRAVKRGELPPPVRLFGKPTWTAGAILAHLEARLEAAKQEAEREAARIARNSP